MRSNEAEMNNNNDTKPVVCSASGKPLVDMMNGSLTSDCTKAN